MKFDKEIKILQAELKQLDEEIQKSKTEIQSQEDSMQTFISEQMTRDITEEERNTSIKSFEFLINLVIIQQESYILDFEKEKKCTEDKIKELQSQMDLQSNKDQQSNVQYEENKQNINENISSQDKQSIETIPSTDKNLKTQDEKEGHFSLFDNSIQLIQNKSELVIQQPSESSQQIQVIMSGFETLQKQMSELKTEIQNQKTSYDKLELEMKDQKIYYDNKLELEMKNQKIYYDNKLELEMKNQKIYYDNKISKLEAEMKELKLENVKQIQNLTSDLTKYKNDNDMLKDQFNKLKSELDDTVTINIRNQMITLIQEYITFKLPYKDYQLLIYDKENFEIKEKKSINDFMLEKAKLLGFSKEEWDILASFKQDRNKDINPNFDTIKKQEQFMYRLLDKENNIHHEVYKKAFKILCEKNYQ